MFYLREDLLDLIKSDPAIRKMEAIEKEAEEIIIHEKQANRELYLLLDGTVELTKTGADGNQVLVDRLYSGDLVGLVSFVSEGPALTTAAARSGVRLLRISSKEFAEILEGKSGLSPFFHPLIINNLLNRYQHTVGLQLNLEQTTRQLNSERDQLKAAITHIENVQKQLISQEKMALLGKISAGISHELNNPTAALGRSVDHLEERVGAIIDAVKEFTPDQVHTLFEYGRTDKPASTTEARKTAKELEKSHKHAGRSMIRKLARCSDNTRKYFLTHIPGHLWTSAFSMYETGQILSIMSDSTGRIASLVRSLRTFSRPPTGYEEQIDIIEGIENTVKLLQYKLKNIDVELDVQEVPPISGNSGELNQVWTNILDNACDAVRSGNGRITIRVWETDDTVYLDFIDNGPGIPDDLKERVFMTNFSTKNSDGSFGLGIGLPISRDIITRHKGHIMIKDNPDGGTCFRVTLPAVQSHT